MTVQEFRAKLQQDVHLTWKHAAWLLGATLTWVIAVSATTAVNTTTLATHQKTLDERAPAVIELGRVAEELRGQAKATDQFREDTKERLGAIDKKLEKIDEKLDRALAK